MDTDYPQPFSKRPQRGRFYLIRLIVKFESIIFSRLTKSGPKV